MTELETVNMSAGKEIDVAELMFEVWNRKWIVVGCALFITLTSIIYCFIAPKVYEAHVGLLPPSLSDVAGFNQGRTESAELKQFTVEDVFDVYVKNLQSTASRREFFKNVYLPSLSDIERQKPNDKLYEMFLEDFTIRTPDKNQGDRYELVVRNSSATTAVDWVEQYLSAVKSKSLNEMLENARRETEVKAQSLSEQINSLRVAATQRRSDRVVLLREALSVAKSIGLENIPVMPGDNQSQLVAFMDGNLMFMRGTKALSAEIKALEDRVSDDPFILGLRDLEEKMDYYKMLNIDSKRIAVVRQDGDVETPDSPVKPNKKIIISLAIILGIMVGVFLAVLMLLKARRAQP